MCEESENALSSCLHQISIPENLSKPEKPTFWKFQLSFNTDADNTFF
jgi:hypothetical protein